MEKLCPSVIEKGEGNKTALWHTDDKTKPIKCNNKYTALANMQHELKKEQQGTQTIIFNQTVPRTTKGTQLRNLSSSCTFLYPLQLNNSED